MVMGSAAPATLPHTSAEAGPELQPAAQTAAKEKPQPDLREAVLAALAGAGHRMLTAMLETGEWQVAGNELVIRVATSETVIDMSLGADAKRLAIATASGVLGRAIRLKVVAGGTAQTPRTARTAANGGGRGRAEQDPVVRRMQEKFGAEIRTIIDYREKR